MAYNPVIEDVEGKCTIVVKDAETIKRGYLVGYSSGWLHADADQAVNIYAQYIALETVVGDGVKKVSVCRRCTISDEDGPYTANTAQYLSGTAGGFTETRPAADNDFIQVVGRSLDTYSVRIEIEAPKEFELFFTPDTLDTTGEPGLGTVDAGWAGPQIDGAGEAVYFKGNLPPGLVGDIIEARIIGDSINASAMDFDVTVVGAHVGASNVEDTGTKITAGDIEQADTDNILASIDISACFDSGFYKPGTVFGVLLDPDGITADLLIVGLRIRGWKV